ANATAPNSVALGAGSVATQANTVSVGSPGNERRVTNVAPGVAPSDAATVGHVQSLVSEVNAGLMSQISGLQAHVNRVHERLRDGVALAMAAGGVPAVPNGRRVGIFGNVATYDGNAAAGVGITGVLLETQAFQLQASGSV